MAKNKLGVDFKEVAIKAAGHTAGAAIAAKVQNIKFIKNMTNPVARGLVIAGLGYIGGDVLEQKLSGKGKNGKGNFIKAAGEGMGMIGILTAASAKMPGVFPAISGVEGYEENPLAGLGGYEIDPTLAGLTPVEDPELSGLEYDTV